MPRLALWPKLRCRSRVRSSCAKSEAARKGAACNVLPFSFHTSEKEKRLEYQFKLKKPLLSSTATEPCQAPSAEQIALVDSISHTLLVMLAKQLLADGEKRQLLAPFELFELNECLCDVLGLERSRMIMLELTGDRPELIWEDDDLCNLRARDVADLRRVAAGLATIRRDVNQMNSLFPDIFKR